MKFGSLATQHYTIMLVDTVPIPIDDNAVAVVSHFNCTARQTTRGVKKTCGKEPTNASQHSSRAKYAVILCLINASLF